MLQNVIDYMEPVLMKDPDQWTYQEVTSMVNQMGSLQNSMDTGVIENFMFAYLHILYYYRLFFVGKRFNKEDGTMWIMRALESVIDLVVPYNDQDNPPPSPAKLTNEEPVYPVVFFELQNTTAAKRNSIVGGITLDADKITTLYVRVMWTDKDAYDKWVSYSRNRNAEYEVPEVVEVTRIVEGVPIKRYAMKPINGEYKLYSAEYIENEKNLKWNAVNKFAPQRIAYDFDSCVMNIEWGDTPGLTPIRWNVFGTVNINNLLEYSRASVSPEELICLSEEGADFWTIRIPRPDWPTAIGYKTKLKIKMKTDSTEDVILENDPYITLLGPMAHTIYPITNKQERPMAGMGQEVPGIMEQLNSTIVG